MWTISGMLSAMLARTTPTALVVRGLLMAPKTLDTIDAIRLVQTDIQRVPFETQDGLYSIDAWFLPRTGTTPPWLKARPLQLRSVCRNEHYAPRVRFFHELGYNVYVWDYRGYGHSLPIDASQEAAPPQNRGLDGRCQPSLSASARTRPGQVQADCLRHECGSDAGRRDGRSSTTPRSVRSCSKLHSNLHLRQSRDQSLSVDAWSLLTSGLIENEIKLSDITTPTLMIHGDSDDRVHINEVKRLFDALPEDLPKSWVVFEEAGHGLGGEGGIPEQGLGAYGEVLQNFLQNNAPNCLTE